MFHVLIRQNEFRGIKSIVAIKRGSFDGDIRVIPHEPALVIRMIDIVALVAEDRIIAQHKEAMSKTTRDKELTMVLGRENHALPLPVCLATGTQLNTDIEHSSLNNPDKLALRMLNLKMKSTQTPPVLADWLSCTNSQSIPPTIKSERLYVSMK